MALGLFDYVFCIFFLFSANSNAFMHLKPKHLESLFIADLYKVQGGDVLGLKALIADSQICLDLALCVGNGWMWKPLLFSRQMWAISVCGLVAHTISASWLVSRLNGSPILQDERDGESWALMARVS